MKAYIEYKRGSPVNSDIQKAKDGFENMVYDIVSFRFEDIIMGKYELDEQYNYFISEYFDDPNIQIHYCGNCYTGDDDSFLFVCKGNTLQEQLDNIDVFLEAINKYIPVTKEELNIVHGHLVS
jgi:hypothetical protein